jgi:hypothetical protein
LQVTGWEVCDLLDSRDVTVRAGEPLSSDMALGLFAEPFPSASWTRTFSPVSDPDPACHSRWGGIGVTAWGGGGSGLGACGDRAWWCRGLSQVSGSGHL